MQRIDAKLRGLFLFAAMSVCLVRFRGVVLAQESAAATPVPSSYTLGPGDQLTFSGVAADEIANKPFRFRGLPSHLMALLDELIHKSVGKIRGELELQNG